MYKVLEYSNTPFFFHKFFRIFRASRVPSGQFLKIRSLVLKW